MPVKAHISVTPESWKNGLSAPVSRKSGRFYQTLMEQTSTFSLFIFQVIPG